MANVKEITQIIEQTPNDQPVMLEGIHGIGKSEAIKDHFEKKGYRVVVLFLGQMSDAGDILGLPERKEIEVEGKKITTTDFCPPAWWPHSENEKVILFLDELNRAKPEIHQVIMDMVLNRKLYNRKLPEDCRIVAAVNPLEDGIYQVEELDPALLDRFNKYEFKPTTEEWIDWAVKNKVHKYVMGFISRHNNLLDPPHQKEYRAGFVTPSRRSWKKVSDILNNTKMLDNVNLLKTTLLGIVGTSATSAFGKYLKEANTGIHAGSLITKYNAKMEAILLTMNTQDFVALNREICFWFENNHQDIFTKSNKTNASTYTYNLEKYLNIIPAEVMAEFISLMSDANREGKNWPKKVIDLNHEIGNKMIDMLAGEDDSEDDKLKENIAD